MQQKYSIEIPRCIVAYFWVLKKIIFIYLVSKPKIAYFPQCNYICSGCLQFQLSLANCTLFRDGRWQLEIVRFLCRSPPPFYVFDMHFSLGNYQFAAPIWLPISGHTNAGPPRSAASKI